MDMPMRLTGRVAKEGMRPFMGVHPYSWVFQLLILIAVGLIIYWVLRGNRRESAMDIVKKRFAKGEITEKEFKKIKKEIV
jgi:putative membrane protein